MFYQELVQELEKVKKPKEFVQLRTKLARKYKLPKVPTIIEILCNLTKEQIEQFKEFMVTKPTRTISGVAPLAIMTKPFDCPVQAKCTFCPGGPGSVYGDTPKSYPGGSPAHKRGERNFYDAYLQVFNRLEHYVLLNQDCSKTELIIMGGTFTTYPKAYRHEFITYALKAMNDFSDMFFTPEFDLEKFKAFFELPSEVFDDARTQRIHEKLLPLKGSTTLEAEQKRNETSNIRCVTFCIETRADCSLPVHIDDMLQLGATRAEVGTQSVYDDVLEKVERGNDNAANIKATQLLRDSFLKVGYHMMLGLPGSSRERDINMFEEIFVNPAYKPDALKVYPCMVFKGTKLFDQYQQGKFKPINAKEAVERIVAIKKFFPEYCRVMRIQRDIPTYMVDAGVERTNVRQEVHTKLQELGLKCRCIRCREPKQQSIDWDTVKLQRLNFEAAQGQEVFLSFNDTKNDLLLGFLRLRNPYQPYRKEITANTVGVREIHVYGTAVKVGEQVPDMIQHKGLGTQLMEAAEKIAIEEFDAKKMCVISGIGVREYFRKKFGYTREGPYMAKKLA